MAAIHIHSAQISTASPANNITGEVTMPQKNIVIPSARKNGSYEGRTALVASGALVSVGELITTLLRLLLTPRAATRGTRTQCWPGLPRGRPCRRAPTSTAPRPADRLG